MAKKQKAYVIMIREATQDKHEVYEHDEDLISKDKKRCWVRTSDPLITQKGERYYYSIATEPRTIPIGKGKALPKKGKFMGQTATIPIWSLSKEERKGFSKYSTQKIQSYHDYRFLDELKKKISRQFSEIFFIIMTGVGVGLMLHILLSAIGM